MTSAPFVQGLSATYIERDFIRATGPDAQSFLQGQVTQDVDAMSVGESRLSFVLQPHGKVDAFVRITRTGDSEYLIDTAQGYGETLLARLNRFKMRTKIEFETLPWKTLAVRGPGADNFGATQSARLVLPAFWRNNESIDIVGAEVSAPEGLAMGDRHDFEAARILSGMPEMGSELDEKTIPAEAGINELAISFTKGCYTGQELVARIDARGNNLARHLRAVRMEGNSVPAVGASIVATGRSVPGAKPLGRITSAGHSKSLGVGIALAYVRRDIFPPATAQILVEDVLVPCRLETVPFG